MRHGDRRGYARTIEGFWDEAAAAGIDLPQPEPVTAQAFSLARAKLPAEVVRSLVHRASDEFDRAHGDSRRWRGRRLLAVDGARRPVQRSPELLRAFGTPEGAHYPQVHVSTLYDVCAEVPVDAVVGPYGSDERRQLFALLDRTREGDVLVLDRGYPSHDVLAMLRLRAIDFVVRVPESSTFAPLEAFLAAGHTDGVIELEPPRGSPVASLEPLRVRVVVVARRGGGRWVLLTSLGAEEFTARHVADAYTRRWRVEEFYKLVSNTYFGQGFFHGRSVRGVEQEIHAQMLFVVIARALAAAAAATAASPGARLSQKAVVLAMSDHLTRLVLRRPVEAARADLDRLLRRIARAVERPRPPRSCPRRSRLPARKWGPDGRRSGA